MLHVMYIIIYITAAQALLSLYLSKCNIVGNHMSRLNLFSWFCGTVHYAIYSIAIIALADWVVCFALFAFLYYLCYLLYLCSVITQESRVKILPVWLGLLSVLRRWFCCCLFIVYCCLYYMWGFALGSHFVVQYFESLHVLQPFRWGRERAGCLWSVTVTFPGNIHLIVYYWKEYTVVIPLRQLGSRHLFRC